MDKAKAAMNKPHEIWKDKEKDRKVYVRFERDAAGHKVVNAVDSDSRHVLSWHTNETSYDHYRKGRLLYVRK